MEELTKKEKTFITNTQKKISKTVFEKNLISEGDRIVIGLSGGKDSLILLDTLASRRRALKFDFELAAVHINVSNVPYEVDLEFMQQLCDFYNVPFFKIDISVDFTKDEKMSPCFICSWHRRTALFKFVNQNGYNKLAFGHHLDDAIETLLLNISFNAEISAMPFEVDMFNGKFKIIRPMLETEEKFLIEYARLKNFNREVKTCSYAKESKRDLIRELIANLEKVNKDVKKNIYRSMGKIVQKYLPE